MKLPFRLSLATALLLSVSVARAAWTVETVDNTENTGGAAALALHPTTDAPAISYNRWHGPTFPNNYYTYCALLTGGTWSLEEVSGTLMTTSRQTSVAFSNQGNPAVTYQYFMGNVRYSTRVGGSWSSPLDVTANAGSGFSSLVMQGTSPIVAFIDGAGQTARFASLVNNSFQVSTLEQSTNADGPISMAQLDDYVAIVFLKGGKLAGRESNNGGMTIGSMPGFPANINATYCALTVAPSTKDNDPASRRAHIIYYDGATGLYRYITDDTETGAWTSPETIYQSGLNSLSQFGLSIVIDSDNVPHVAFLDYGSNRLAYSKRVSGAWTTPEWPDGANLGGVNASIKLTSTGRPRIAFGALTFSNNNYNLAGLKFAALDPDVPVPPTPSSLTFTIKGKARRTAAGPATTLRGTASSSVTAIQWKLGKKPFRTKAVSGGSWTARISPLTVGRNVVSVRATGGGSSTAVRKIIVKRRR